MRIEYDPALIEKAVDLAVFGNRDRERDLHRELDPVYAMEEGRPREIRFRDVYATSFSNLGLDAALNSLLEERPIIAQEVGRCIIRGALRGKSESAELFVIGEEGEESAGTRTLVLQVAPQSFAETEGFIPRMRRELLHVADMVDVRFAYRREELDGLPSRQNLVRDRYTVLWDVYIEGRLTREGRGEPEFEPKLRRMFARVFRGSDESALEEAFDQAFDSESLTHGQMLGWARSPVQLLGTPEAQPRKSENLPGGTCPLCSFPTYDWFDFFGQGGPTPVEAIRGSYPEWDVEQGACRQCVEIFSAAAHA